MKHRTARRLFITIAVVAAVAAVVGIVHVVAQYRGRQSDADFLSNINERAGRNEGSVAGDRPPVQGDSDLVPVIEVEPPEQLDVGVIPNDRPYETEIVVRNAGRTPLVISQVDSQCLKCTRPTIAPEDKRVRPGQSVKIKIVVYPSGIPSFRTSKLVTIMSNDVKKPTYKVEVVAQVDPEFLLEPAEIDFGTIAKGTPATHTILFRQLDEQRVEIEGFEQSALSGALDLSFEERPESEWLVPDRTEYDLYVGLPEDVSPGKLATRLHIKTTCKRLQRFPRSGSRPDRILLQLRLQAADHDPPWVGRQAAYGRLGHDQSGPPLRTHQSACLDRRPRRNARAGRGAQLDGRLRGTRGRSRFRRQDRQDLVSRPER